MYKYVPFNFYKMTKTIIIKYCYKHHVKQNLRNLSKEIRITKQSLVLSAITCPKLTIEKLEQGKKYVQS